MNIEEIVAELKRSATEDKLPIEQIKTICATLVIFGLSGCFYQTVSDNDWDKATRYCAEKRGVLGVRAHYDGREIVECKDGTVELLQ
jgi:hypothetical protein